MLFKKDTITQFLISLTMAVMVALLIIAELLFEARIGKKLMPLVILTSLLLAFFFQPLSLRIKRWVERLFFYQDYKREAAINQFSRQIVSTLNKDILLTSIKKTISEVSQPAGIKIWLLDASKKRYLINLDGKYHNYLMEGADFGFNHPLVQRLSSSRYGLRRSDVEPELQRYFEHEEAELFLPLIYKDNLLGLISLGEKSSKTAYGDEEVRLLLTLAVKASLALTNINLYEEETKGLFDSIRSLIEAIEAKDAYTRGHCERVADIASSISIKLELKEEDVEEVRIAGLLHDIGKIGVAEQTLNKKGMLNFEEFQQIKRHPVIGAKIIKSLPFSKSIVEAIYHHHERYDGHGYPDKLSNGNIPFFARILQVADSYEAMTSNRPYRQAMPKERAIQELLIGNETQFDPAIVKAFLELVDRVSGFRIQGA